MFSFQRQLDPPLALAPLVPSSFLAAPDAAPLLKTVGLERRLWRWWWGLNVHALQQAVYGAG